MQEERKSPGGKVYAWQNPAVSALMGALIGAMAGLAGSVLVYVQAERVQDATANARRSDIRRSAYVEVGTSSQSFRTEMNGVVNFIGEASTAQVEEVHNTRYIPAANKLVQAETTARLVGTAESRRMLARTVPHRESLAEMVALAFQGETLDVDKYSEVMKKYEDAFAAFMNEADEEVI
ncbi:hypothetical protein [Streptomyces sp. NRRL S-118]|uniref:hypothetical protein n=1 Tax=Streptomyces sp. NRRL S-118 TaxID=1463881 RepID=UPI00131C36AA|nr:hypothetical protein [Streptomyces sp. NRRL S-118]